MAATIEPFQYPPLPEPTQWIRILHLEPSTRRDAPLRGRLVETRLDAHADYHAVSYLWGDMEAPLTDWCELLMTKAGVSNSGHAYARLPIRASCSTVLRHLRRNRKTRALWIDAVCIDQSNLSERGHQVRIMPSLYRDASKVAMWLDLSHVSARHCIMVFKLAKMMTSAYRWGLVNIFVDDKVADSIINRLWLRFQRLRYTNRYVYFCFHNLKKVLDSPAYEETLLSILDSPYFGRTWTVQELVMAPIGHIEMHSSLGTVPWARILALIEFRLARTLEFDRNERMLRIHRRLSCRGSFNEDKSLLRNTLKGSLTYSESRLIDLWNAEGSVYPFSDLPSLLASDPRDKAYAFLWALQRCRPVDFDVFNVDYTKTVETVFTEFTIAVAHETGDFAALFQLACQQDKMSTLPSWVPDWSSVPHVQEWNFLRPFGTKRTINRIENPHLSSQDIAKKLTFENAAMRIHGLCQVDRVSQRERVPVLSSNDTRGSMFLTSYSPHAIETISIALNNVFQMLDDAEDLASLTRLYRHNRTWGDDVPLVIPEELECLVPGALERPDTMHYTIIRGIIRSYIRAKRSPDPSDVDFDEWSRGLTAEFKDFLTEEVLESLLLELSGYKDYPYGTLNARGFEEHIVRQLIECRTFFSHRVVMMWEVADFASGKSGATIFKTDGGSLGFGQANIEVGDEVVQCTGVARPIVVRMLEAGKTPESQPEERRCRLVSVAEVDGITMTEEKWREEDLITYVFL